MRKDKIFSLAVKCYGMKHRSSKFKVSWILEEELSKILNMGSALGCHKLRELPSPTPPLPDLRREPPDRRARAAVRWLLLSPDPQYSPVADNDGSTD
ncbi:hypothetical protein LWI29_023082 [Acer saccharum]|uniref:Uncharacterized protein n=1 Tax=Acer saccharum TaxID=4024 RepID=A0AA39VNR0_ACESA|nr:hypothetical protein LWI29_023082 [Acer saccharum]